MEASSVLEKYDWKQINEKLEGIKFSIIGSILPTNIDKEVTEVLQIALNQVYIDPKSDEFIKKIVVFGKENNDFTDEQLDILKGILSEAKRDEIASRIGVILWFKRKDYRSGLVAIDAYKNLFKIEKDAGNVLAVLHVIAAFNLMNQLGKRKESNKYIEQIIDNDIEGNNKFTYALLDFLVNKEKFASLTSDAQNRYKEYLNEEAKKRNSGDFIGRLLAKIAQKENNLGAEKKAYSYIASFWYDMAQISGEPLIRKAEYYSKASNFYRKSGNDEKAGDCLKESKKLLNDTNNWHHHVEKIDLSPIFDCLGDLDNKDIVSRIKYISNLTRINYSQIMSLHEGMLNNKENGFSFYGLFDESSIDDKGVVRSSRPGFSSDKAASEIPYLINHAVPLVHMLSQIIRIANDKYVLSKVKDITFSEIIKPFLPTNIQMVDFIIRSVLSEKGEIVVESLMVTFESLLAAIVERSGFSSIKQNEDKTQEDITMGPLVEICRDNHLLREDDLFLIEVLLCNKNGFNLRNISNHRLTSDINRGSSDYLFCGYFLIRLLIEYS